MSSRWRKAPMSFAATTALLMTASSATHAQDVNQLVEQFYPASGLEVESPDDRRMCHAVLQETQAGAAQLIVAAYTNVNNGVVRVIANQGGAYVVASESDPSLLLGGFGCAIEKHDFNGDGQADVFVRFDAMRGNGGWAFLLNGTALQHVSAGSVDIDDRAVLTEFGNAEVVDLYHDGTLQIVNMPTFDYDAPETEPSVSATQVFRFGANGYEHEKFVLATQKFIKRGELIDESLTFMTFRTAVDSTGPYRITVTNGKRSGRARTSSAEIWLNGKALPSSLNSSTEFVELEQATLPIVNELRVVFGASDSLDAQVTITIEDSTVGRTPEQPVLPVGAPDRRGPDDR